MITYLLYSCGFIRGENQILFLNYKSYLNSFPNECKIIVKNMLSRCRTLQKQTNSNLTKNDISAKRDIRDKKYQ